MFSQWNNKKCYIFKQLEQFNRIVLNLEVNLVKINPLNFIL
jgi:hypothetical protein